MPSIQDALRSRVYNFYSRNLSSGKIFTIKHFMEEGVLKMTVYDILKRYENNLPAIRRSGSGRTVKIFTAKKINQLKKDFDHKDGISQRQTAKKYKCSQSIVNYVLKKAKIDC